MTDWSIVFARSARKELERLPEAHRGRMLTKIEALTTNPRPHGTRKLKGSPDLWRLRSGEYRVVYALDDAERVVDIVAVRHRKEAYR